MTGQSFILVDRAVTVNTLFNPNKDITTHGQDQKGCSLHFDILPASCDYLKWPEQICSWIKLFARLIVYSEFKGSMFFLPPCLEANSPTAFFSWKPHFFTIQFQRSPEVLSFPVNRQSHMFLVLSFSTYYRGLALERNVVASSYCSLVLKSVCPSCSLQVIYKSDQDVQNLFPHVATFYQRKFYVVLSR